MRFLCSITLALFFAFQGAFAVAETPNFEETKQLAEQGNAVAQSSLGVLYAQGKGVPQDNKEAVNWYRLAAKQGNAAAQTNLGVVYAQGLGVRKDFTIAHMWFNIAAKNGDVSGAAARDLLALEMTAASIAKAQEMARECLGSDYRDCGAK